MHAVRLRYLNAGNCSWALSLMVGHFLVTMIYEKLEFLKHFLLVLLERQNKTRENKTKQNTCQFFSIEFVTIKQEIGHLRDKIPEVMVMISSSDVAPQMNIGWEEN